MSRKSKVQYELSDLRGQKVPSEEEIKNILRAADEIIFVAGRTMLAKILKGSKDKKLIEKELNNCPSYGYYNQLSIEEITKIIDWMIVNNYLDIDYNGRLPMIIFSDKGFETYKPFYVDELYNCILNVSENTSDDFIEQLKQTNREVVKLLLLRIGVSKNIGFIRFLTKWEAVEVKKVRFMIKGAISKLKALNYGNSNFGDVYKDVKNTLEEARSKAYSSINFYMVKAYWRIGKIINEAQDGNKRAEYGRELINELSKNLTIDYGKGFDKSNLSRMRKFYSFFNNIDALRQELSWTHYRLIIKVDDEKKRSFYIDECIKSNWSTRQLERQINSFYYERLVSTQEEYKNEVRNEINKLEEKRDINDIVKDPYILEFLNLKDNKKFLEKDLEQGLMDNLQEFLLELGKGFSFVGRQRRITADGEHFYIDLVFYNYLLKCFVLIDLKLGKLTHQDIGQMDFYVRYYEKEIKGDDDNPTIGIILCSEKNQTIVKYSILEESKQIFASKYMLYMPTEEELKMEIKKDREILEIEERMYEDK